MKTKNKTVTALTFYQWLNLYELITKKEYNTFRKEVQENYKGEYEMWLKDTSQYNYYDL